MNKNHGTPSSSRIIQIDAGRAVTLVSRLAIAVPKAVSQAGLNLREIIQCTKEGERLTSALAMMLIGLCHGEISGAADAARLLGLKTDELSLLLMPDGRRMLRDVVAKLSADQFAQRDGVSLRECSLTIPGNLTLLDMLPDSSPVRKIKFPSQGLRIVHESTCIVLAHFGRKIETATILHLMRGYRPAFPIELAALRLQRLKLGISFPVATLDLPVEIEGLPKVFVLADNGEPDMIWDGGSWPERYRFAFVKLED